MSDFEERMAAAMASLLPCPFCRGRNVKIANVVVDDVGDRDWSEVFCIDCKARGPKADDWEMAVVKWDEQGTR